MSPSPPSRGVLLQLNRSCRSLYKSLVQVSTPVHTQGDTHNGGPVGNRSRTVSRTFESNRLSTRRHRRQIGGAAPVGASGAGRRRREVPPCGSTRGAASCCAQGAAADPAAARRPGFAGRRCARLAACLLAVGGAQHGALLHDLGPSRSLRSTCPPGSGLLALRARVGLRCSAARTGGAPLLRRGAGEPLGRPQPAARVIRRFHSDSTTENTVG